MSLDAELSAARSAIDQRDWPLALSTLHAAAQVYPSSADVHNLLGYSYRMQSPQALPLAITHYREALRLDVNHLGAHEYIGRAYLMLDRPDDALRHLETLQRLCGDLDCPPRRQLMDAIEAYRRSGTAQPTDGGRYHR